MSNSKSRSLDVHVNVDEKRTFRIEVCCGIEQMPISIRVGTVLATIRNEYSDYVGASPDMPVTINGEAVQKEKEQEIEIPDGASVAFLREKSENG